jgi:integrase
MAGEVVMKRTTTMVALVEDYLAARRRMGFDLKIAGEQVLAFARFADQSNHRGPLTLDLAIRWALSSRDGQLLTRARRLEVLRPFFRYRAQFDSGTEILPAGLFGPAHRRLVPHIYSEHEVASLLEAASGLPPAGGLRPLTYHTLFGLLAATGLRISEALHLQLQDVHWQNELLIVRQTKYRKSRLVPLHPTTIAVLRHYADVRQRKHTFLNGNAFFVSDQGNSLADRTVHDTFARLRKQLRWVARGGHPAPRIHDLRHTFICRALLRSYRRRQPVDSVIDALSTYVGHAKVSDTYWYVTATPELMAVAAERFAGFAERGGR